MSDLTHWRISIKLGHWYCPVEVPKAKFELAQDAINFAVQAVIDAREALE